MSTITKEWLESQISAIKVVGITDSNTLQAFEIALASLEAEAVGYMNGFTGRVFTLEEQPGADTDVNVYVPVYAAPPAPVSVPAAMEMDDDFDSAFEHGKAVGWNAYRAAMLQGAEPVTTAYKLRDAVETIRNSGIVIDADKIFAERDALNAPVIPDGYCIMPLKLTADNGAKGALCGEFHVQYRIVCQSCVGEGCEDCNHTGGWDAEIPVGWDTIKRIHEAAVEACAMPAAPQQEVK